ncbi:RagB/SusD family nutrient uptake outer membrane protein, partial [Mariniphaga sediminis]|uniref:RagB/SusD family nutrient uptake outer membrane protein n=1 Tax=Mariniphaga sediminis TaxID=1628158 RepID=UPI003568F27D
MKKYRYSVIISLLMVLSVSCEDYLDQAPEASITENDIFTNFTDFQGFVEEMYYCITDWNKAGAWNPYLFADEVLNNYDYQFDRGNYWDQSRLFYGTRANPASDQPRDKRIWQLCWQGIRKANVALSKAEEYFQNAPQEEQDLIRGQALFFRGYFHFELMRWWGGMPYIDTLLSPTQDLKLARLTFQEGAIRAA